MTDSDSSSMPLKGIHPRLKARMDAKQVDMFAAPQAEKQTESAPKPTAPTKTSVKKPSPVTVSDLCKSIKSTLKDELGTVYVQGELADFKGVHRNGHLYCSLKDDSAQVRMVMWKGALNKVPFDLKGGLEVIVRGKIDFYGGSGSLQINVERIEPVGVGALQLKFEQLKERLEAEGLFAEERKRPIPQVCWRVGLVTGKSTAALQDMLRIFKQRFPLSEVFLFNSSMQGEKAPGEVVSAIETANRFSIESGNGLDVIIVARGGGSYEDLFCFNDERIARAIVASKIPVVSAIGHEIDYTISDFVSDRRSATPTHAAQEVIPDINAWVERLDELGTFFEDNIHDKISTYQEKVDYLYNRLVAMAPQKRIEREWERLKSRRIRFEDLMKSKLQRTRAEVSQRAAVLDALSPLKVFERGYSMTTDKKGKAIRSVSQVKVGDVVAVALADGNMEAKVDIVTKS